MHEIIQPRRLHVRAAWLLLCMAGAAMFGLDAIWNQILASALLSVAFALIGLALFVYVPIHSGLRWQRFEPLMPGGKVVADVLAAGGLLLLFAGTALSLFAFGG